MSTDQTSGSPWDSHFAPGAGSGAGFGADQLGSFFAIPSFDGGASFDEVEELDLSAIHESELDSCVDLVDEIAGEMADRGDPADQVGSAGQSDTTRSSNDRKSDTGNPSGNPPSDAIEFRVIRTGTPVRRLRLTGNRYTFGSAEGCSIRLNDPTLRPMHAVLIRDPSRVLVRAYSVPINVNGNQRTETTLAIGDVMRLGVYQFELMSVAPQVASPVNAPEPARSSSPSSIFDKPTRSADRSATLPSSEDVIWRERLRREIDQWRERQIECDQREASLRGRETELWTRAETLLRRESRLQSQESTILQLQEDYSQRQQDLMELREQTHAQKESLRLREAEFRRQELEYRGKLGEASRQLHQSQQQAESATQAVQRMREQFESLNRQIDELSSDQRSIQQNEQQQRQASENFRAQLESERDQAIDAHSHSESLRLDAEARIEAMALELESIKDNQGVDLQAKQRELAQSEALVVELQAKITDLQTAVGQASDESARLRSDYTEACESVRQLESLVAQSNQRGDRDRESWVAEADQLRSAMDQLSIDLARANAEVSELRTVNEALSVRLQRVQSERDAAESRPTHEAFESLQRELESANDKLAEMKRDYERTIQDRNDSVAQKLATIATPPFTSNRAAADRGNSEADQVAAEAVDQGSDDEVIRVGLLGDRRVTPNDHQDDIAEAETPAASLETSAPEADLEADPEAAPEAASEAASDVEADRSDAAPESEPEGLPAEAANFGGDADEADSEDDVWPTYQSVAPEIESSMAAEQALKEEISEDEDVPSEPSSLATHDDSPGTVDPWSAISPWQSSDIDEDDIDEDDVDRDNVAGHVSDEADAAVASDDPEVDTADSISVWQSPSAMDSEHDDDDDIGPVKGSLASRLIKDLESQSGSFEQAEAEIDRGVNQDADDEIDVAATYDGTFVLKNESPASAWSPPGEAAGWDREYQEESDAEDFVIPSLDQPSSLSDDLGSDDFNSTDDRRSDVSIEDSPSLTVEENATVPNEISDVQASETVDEDDDSIEAYMNRLLNRVQGSSGNASTSTKPETLSMSTSTPVQTPTKSTSTSASLSPLSSSSVGSSAEPTGPIESMDPNAPLVPRSQAPERKSDLSAMRELANSSARTAISHSTKIQIRNIQLAGLFSLGVAAVAIIAALLCMVMLSGSLLYLAWVMALIIAGISVRDAMNNFAEAKRRTKVRSDSNEQHDTPDE